MLDKKVKQFIQKSLQESSPKMDALRLELKGKVLTPGLLSRVLSYSKISWFGRRNLIETHLPEFIQLLHQELPEFQVVQDTKLEERFERMKKHVMYNSSTVLKSFKFSMKDVNPTDTNIKKSLETNGVSWFGYRTVIETEFHKSCDFFREEILKSHELKEPETPTDGTCPYGKDLLKKFLTRGGSCQYFVKEYRCPTEGVTQLRLTWMQGRQSECVNLSTVRERLANGSWKIVDDVSGKDSVTTVAIDAVALDFQSIAKALEPSLGTAFLRMQDISVSDIRDHLKKLGDDCGLCSQQRAVTYKHLHGVLNALKKRNFERSYGAKPIHDDHVDALRLGVAGRRWASPQSDKLLFRQFCEQVSKGKLAPWQCDFEESLRSNAPVKIELARREGKSMQMINRKIEESPREIHEKFLADLLQGNRQHPINQTPTNPVQTENNMNAQAPELNDVAFETVDFIFGQEASKLTESQLFAAVTKTQAKIKSLEDLNIKSEYVTTQIEKLTDGLKLIVKTIDALSE